MRGGRGVGVGDKGDQRSSSQFFSKFYLLITNPSLLKTKPFLTPCQLPCLTYCVTPQLITILREIQHNFLIALQLANRMLLNNIINAVRTKQKKNTNKCLYALKMTFLWSYFTIFYLLLQRMLFYWTRFSEFAMNAKSLGDLSFL